MVSFKQVNGSAKKGELEYFKFKDGSNTFRMFGGILARYVYWVKTRDGSTTVPMECLSFDREEERFTNVEEDVVRAHFPDLQCSWSYMVLCIDPSDGKLKALGLKKKMFEQIILAAQELGDPTDVDSGWTVSVNRKKNGPQAYNVEYTVEVLKCQKNIAPLTPEEREIVAEAKSIDEYYPRTNPEDQLAFMKRSILPEEEEANVDDDAMGDLAKESEKENYGVGGKDDDIPF